MPVIRSNRVREMLDHYNIYYEEDPAKRIELLYICPFHDDHDIGSAKFNEDREVFNCFSCNEGGNIYEFVAKMEKCTTVQARLLIENDFQGQVQYGIDVLQRRLERATAPHPHTLEYQRTAEKAVHRMLQEMCVRNVPVEFFNRWILISSWIYYLNAPDLVRRSKLILDLYSTFFTELHSYQPKETV